MTDLTHIFKVGQPVKWNCDGDILTGTVKETYTDHIIVNIPEMNDHCYFEEGFNLDTLYPAYNF